MAVRSIAIATLAMAMVAAANSLSNTNLLAQLISDWDVAGACTLVTMLPREDGVSGESTPGLATPHIGAAIPA